jgi:hypothetical protein
MLARIAFLALAALLALTHCRASAWNNVGHMTVAKLVYDQMTDGQKLKAIAILTQHPHFAMFLNTNRPDGVAENEWVFLRASTWPDWIRPMKPPDPRGEEVTKYNIPGDHYINKPFVLPADQALFADQDLSPNPNNNILLAFDRRMAQLKADDTSAEERAVALCWVLHLIGDIHQPLHCTSFFSALFADKDNNGKLTGDRGGNSFGVKIGGRKYKLHAFWDDLLGVSTGGYEDTPANLASVYGLVKQAAETLHDPQYNREKFPEIKGHTTFATWVDEGVELAKSRAYLNGELKPVKVQNDTIPDDANEAPGDYQQKAVDVAHRRISLAAYRLSDKLSEFIPGS